MCHCIGWVCLHCSGGRKLCKWRFHVLSLNWANIPPLPCFKGIFRNFWMHLSPLCCGCCSQAGLIVVEKTLLSAAKYFKISAIKLNIVANTSGYSCEMLRDHRINSWQICKLGFITYWISIMVLLLDNIIHMYLKLWHFQLSFPRSFWRLWEMGCRFRCCIGCRIGSWQTSEQNSGGQKSQDI